MVNLLLHIAWIMDISVLLREMRIEHGYTQSQVADLLNIQPSSYNRYESGVHQIKLKEFIKLIQIYGPGSYQRFTTFLQKNGLDVISKIDPGYYTQLNESQAKYELITRRKDELTKQKDALKREVDLLQELLKAREEMIQMLKDQMKN